MDLNKAVEHCWDRRDYPEIISDDAGLDISIPRFITRGPWREHNRPRRITLNVTTYIGTSWNAVHYYGNLDIEGISFSQEELADLIRDSIKLSYLEAGGVDNWTWYDEALTEYNEDDLDDDTLTNEYKDA